MFNFLLDNWGTILVSCAVFGTAAVVLAGLIRKKRSGVCVSCDGCKNAGMCGK